MKNILNNKILIIILLFAIILGFGSNVFADNDTIFHVNSTNEDVILPSWLNNYYYLISYKQVGGFTYFKCLLSDSPFTITIVNDTYRFHTSYGRDLSVNIGEIYSAQKCIDRYLNTEPTEFYEYNHGYIQLPISGFSDDYICNHDLIDSSNSENVVFQGAPQFQITELAKIVEQTQAGDKVLAEVVGILPVIMIILVSIIAIWKAIRLLRNVLKTS